MSLLLGKETCNPTLLIQEWQQAADQEEAERDVRSVTSQLCGDTINLYREIIRHLSNPRGSLIPKDTFISLERSYGALVLWDESHGVSEGRLDERLSKSQVARISTLKCLTGISRTLTESMHVSHRISWPLSNLSVLPLSPEITATCSWS